MFKVGDCIIYGNIGVCRIDEVGPMQMPGMPLEQLYYTLTPLFSRNSKVYTPVDNNKVIMRHLITREDANRLIDEIESLALLETPDRRQREDCYRQALKQCDCREWIRMIKTLEWLNTSRVSQGKKAPLKEMRYLHQAEEFLYGELSVSLDLEFNQVEQYIHHRMDEKNSIE